MQANDPKLVTELIAEFPAVQAALAPFPTSAEGTTPVTFVSYDTVA